MTSTPGLILVNLGSPDAPTAQATRKYLFQFLHDKRVVDTSRWIWCPILHGVILRVRPARSAKAYRAIWNEPEFSDQETLVETAPLIRITQSQTAGVQALLGETVHVETAMRYGNPSIASAIDKLTAKGCTRIAVLPLYPQFAGATTASVFDGVAKAIKGRMNMPEIRFLRDYYQDPDFIKCLADSLDDHIATLNWKPDAVLTSYHGLPQSYVEKGDPYQGECLETTELLRKHTGFSESYLYSTFQSRFGPKDWLQPYTDKTLETLPGQGIKNVAVMMPGFAADCLETLEEIKIEARDSFLNAGGENFTAVPCLNEREDHIAFLTKLAKERLLRGWL